MDTAIAHMPATTPTASLPAHSEVAGSATATSLTMNWSLIIGVIVGLIISVGLANFYRRKQKGKVSSG